MTLDLMNERGTPLSKQCLTWQEMAGCPYSKLDDDAFTRTRVMLMHATEAKAAHFSHAWTLAHRDPAGPLAECGRIEHLQQVLVKNLNPPDQSLLETSIGYEQSAIEIAAALALAEPDPYMAQAFRYGLLDDLDHLYRFAALADRLEGVDANTILQCYTDIRPGRPTGAQLCLPADEVRHAYDRTTASPMSKVRAILMLGLAHQKCDYYLNAGPMHADFAARMLYAEISTIEAQHITQMACLIDPTETWLEKWLILEAAEVYGYWSCLESEPNARIRGVWERFLDYELGHLFLVKDLIRKHENRDPDLLLPKAFPEPLPFQSHRTFIRETLRREADLTVLAGDFLHRMEDPKGAAEPPSLPMDGLQPSELVARHYQWKPGGELFGEIAKRKEHFLKEPFQ